MKKIWLGLLLLSAMYSATAQKTSPLSQTTSSENVTNLAYTFTAETATYTPLTGTISLTGTAVWDDPVITVPMPFSFTVQGQQVDSFVLDGLGGSLVALQNSNPIFGVVAPFEVDLIDRGYDSTISLSSISYKVDGTAGNRILKIEWKEVGSYGEYSNTGGILAMFISFQAWIYEGTNVIEYRYGANTINDPATFYEGDPGAIIGTALTDGNASLVANLISGPISSPVFSLALQPINGTPANGTLYRLTPIGSSSSVTENSLSQVLKAWPNPVSDLLQIELKQQEKVLVSLYNMQGQKVKQQLLSENRSSLDLRDLPTGAYFIRLEGHVGSMRIIKR